MLWHCLTKPTTFVSEHHISKKSRLYHFFSVSKEKGLLFSVLRLRINASS